MARGELRLRSSRPSNFWAEPARPDRPKGAPSSSGAAGGDGDGAGEGIGQYYEGMSPGPATDPLRVLVLGTTFPARAGDGTPEFVLTLSSSLAAAGAEVRAVVPRVPGAAATDEIEGVDVRRFAYFPRRFEGLAHGAIMANLRAHPWRAAEVPSLLATFQAATLREVRRFRPDVVHAHWVVPAGLVALAAKRATGVPYIVTAHGADAYTLRSPAALAAKRAVITDASATVPVSRAIGEALAPLGPLGEPVPMGADIGRILDEVGARIPEPGRVLFVGRLVEKKGADVLLRAVALVPRVSLVIVGDGPARDELEELARDLGIRRRVQFLGQQSRDGVMAEMARAALVALPSQVGAGGDQDGTPVVLGEAMAAGVPVVVSDLGGLSEQVTEGQTGRVVEPGSVADLARALRAAVAGPEEANRMAARARERMVGALDLKSVGDRYLDLLDAAAGRRPRGGTVGPGFGPGRGVHP